MRSRTFLWFTLLFFAAAHAQSQMISAPQPQPGSIIGVVDDSDGSIIPGASIEVDGVSPDDHHAGISGSDGTFTIEGLQAFTAYRVIIRAQSFSDWTSTAAVTLRPGQQFDLGSVKLAVGEVSTTVSAIQPEALAIQQVQEEEKQRVLGIFPNFYTSYDPRVVPLSSRLKFQLAFRASTDVVTFAASGVLAGIGQASGGSPNYVQGAKGFGQRVGAAYTLTASDILIGGAILPSLLHQDPRYFYQGTGTGRSRALHAISSPFVTRGDNTKWQFNYSSIGGDLSAGALANLYYPPSNRGVGLVFSTALTSIGGRVINAVAQEFILSRFTRNKAAY